MRKFMLTSNVIVVNKDVRSPSTGLLWTKEFDLYFNSTWTVYSKKKIKTWYSFDTYFTRSNGTENTNTFWVFGIY